MRSLLVARPTLAAGGGAVGSLGGVLGSLGGAVGSLGGIVGSVGGVVGSVGGVVVGSLGGMVGSVGTGWPGVVMSSPAGGVSCASAGKLIAAARSEEHTPELQSLMRIPCAVFCLEKKQNTTAP